MVCDRADPFIMSALCPGKSQDKSLSAEAQEQIQAFLSLGEVAIVDQYPYSAKKCASPRGFAVQAWAAARPWLTARRCAQTWRSTPTCPSVTSAARPTSLRATFLSATFLCATCARAQLPYA